MSITNRQSYIINVLKGVLPIMVVALHTSSSAEPLEFFSSTENFLRILIYKLGEAAVPTFFVISGYLFFYDFEQWNWTKWSNKLKKRIGTLLVPYMLWMVVFFFGLYLRSFALSEISAINFGTLKDSFDGAGGFRLFYDRPVMSNGMNMLGYVVPNDKPIDVPLWYMRDLMVLFILAPAIWGFLKITRHYGLIVFFLAYITDTAIPINGFSATGFFFLSCGAWLAINGYCFSVFFEKFRKFAYPTSIVLLTACFALHGHADILESILVKLFIISFVVTLFCLADTIISKGHKPIKLLTDSSFFIYAIHNVLITDIANFLLWRALPFTAEWMLVLKVFLRPAVTVGICLLIFVVMRKICPKILGLLTGGRF